MENDTLTMSSTTDSEAQIREGLGLEPLAPVDPIAAAEAVLAEAQAAAAAAKAAAEPVAEEAVAAAPIVPPPGALTAPPARNSDGTFKPRVAQPPPVVTDPNADVLARATAAETELAALKTRLATLEAQPRPVTPITPITPIAPLTPPVVTSPRLTQIAAEKAALVRPKQADFEDFDLYLDARDTYVSAQAELNIEEKLERKAVAQAQTQAETQAATSATQNLTTYQQRQTAAKLVHADYDTVVTDDVKASPVIAMSLLDPRYEHAAELAYELGSDRVEAQRIYDLDRQAQRENRAPLEAVEAMGALKARVAARMGPGHQGARQTGPTVQVPAPTIRRTTAAPPPTSTTLGATAGAVATDLATASESQLQSMSQADYNRLRDRTTNTRR